MRELNIIDFQYLYYKYKFSIDSGRLTKLSAHGRDVTNLYYPLKEIEGFTNKGTIDTVICFDSKDNERKEKDATYKQNRVSMLNQYDFENINELRDMLKLLGYCVLQQPGKEADDLVAYSLEKLKRSYDIINIYTVDCDLLQLVQPKVSVHIYKQKHGYITVDMNNFEDKATELLKTYIAYNMVMVYKSLVGDGSDNIKGIHRFGTVAYKKWFDKNKDTIACEYCTQKDYVKQLLINNFEGDKLAQALDSLEKVAFNIEGIDKNIEFKQTQDNRNKVYGEYEMYSLI